MFKFFFNFGELVAGSSLLIFGNHHSQDMLFPGNCFLRKHNSELHPKLLAKPRTKLEIFFGSTWVSYHTVIRLDYQKGRDYLVSFKYIYHWKLD